MRVQTFPAGSTTTIPGRIFGFTPLAGAPGATYAPDYATTPTPFEWQKILCPKNDGFWQSITIVAGSTALTVMFAESSSDAQKLPDAPQSQTGGASGTGKITATTTSGAWQQIDTNLANRASVTVKLDPAASGPGALAFATGAAAGAQWKMYPGDSESWDLGPTLSLFFKSNAAGDLVTVMERGS